MGPEGISVLSPARDAEIIVNYVREGLFQRSLSLITAASSLVSGLEASIHSRRVARTALPVLSCLSARVLRRAMTPDRTRVVELDVQPRFGGRERNGNHKTRCRYGLGG